MIYIHKTAYLKVEIKFTDNNIVLYKIVDGNSYGILKVSEFKAKYKEVK